MEAGTVGAYNAAVGVLAGKLQDRCDPECLDQTAGMGGGL